MREGIAIKRIAHSLLKHRTLVIVLMTVCALVCLLLMFTVNVNYDMADYLPDDAPTTKALEAYEQAFGSSLPNLNIYAPDVTVSEALTLKARLAEIDGVSEVLWLDDVADLRVPLEMQDAELVRAWYSEDNEALFMAAMDTADASRIVGEVKAVVGDGVLLSGDAYNQSETSGAGMAEVGRIMYYVLPLVFIILLFATTSWLEPLLFLITIGVAILLNEGTNAFMWGGEICYITQASSALLQLAVSMDYAVFLLHAFERHRKTEPDIIKAMENAVAEAASTIAASATTTVAGFLVLALMSFRVGPDMGWILAKGVAFSYLSVMLLLPSLIIVCHKLLDKTRHRPFMPSFAKVGRIVAKAGIGIAVIVAVLIVPSYLAQQNNAFVYGSSGMHSPDSYVQEEADKIAGVFGGQQQMVLLVPEGDEAREAELTSALADITNVTSVTGYATAVGTEIPEDMLAEDQLSQLRSGGYSRIILYADTNDEGDEAFAVVEDVRAAAEELYGDEYHLLGQSAVNYDLRNTIVGDSGTVTWAAIIAIAVILLLTFKSISLPIILLMAIESAIWINLAIPYYTGDTLNYIGYLVISSVQLGATIDYGILLAQHYLNQRKSLDKHGAIAAAVTTAAPSILTPALILACAGFMLGIVSSSAIISELGKILARGALISCAMVMLFLPALLVLLDGVIAHTTLTEDMLKRRRIKREKHIKDDDCNA